MNIVDTAERLLTEIVESPSRRDQLIADFQNLIWNTDVVLENETVDQMLRDLAYDLDFYEVDESFRAKDTVFYGRPRLEREVGSVLLRLRSALTEPMASGETEGDDEPLM